MTSGVSVYAALGDSFTAGRGAVHGERWPDRIAAALRRGSPQLTYSNLAVDGACSAEVLEQVPAALRLKPDLVTVICGANDVLLTSRPDIEGYERRFEEILRRLQAVGGPAILTATTPESWQFMELRPRTQARVVRALCELNVVTRAVAARRGVPCLDVVGHPGLADRDNFDADGLHPSPLGHERAAAEIARSLHVHFGIDGNPEGGT